MRAFSSAPYTIGGGDRLGPDLKDVSTTRERGWLTRFIVDPEKLRASGDPIALALRATFKQVVMPSLDLAAADAAVLLDYIDRQSRALGDGAGTSGTTTTAAGANVKPNIDPYLRVQQALHADTLAGTSTNARSIAAEAAVLGSGGTAIPAAAGDLHRHATARCPTSPIGARRRDLRRSATRSSGLVPAAGLRR